MIDNITENSPIYKTHRGLWEQIKHLGKDAGVEEISGMLIVKPALDIVGLSGFEECCSGEISYSERGVKG